MTLSIKGLYVTLGISDTQHNNDPLLCWVPLCWVWRFIHYYAECHYADLLSVVIVAHYAECHGA